MSLRNGLLKSYFSMRMKAIDRFRRHPLEVQAAMLRARLEKGARTRFGRECGLRVGMTPAQVEIGRAHV